MKGRVKESLIEEIIESSNSISEDVKQNLLEYWKKKELYIKKGVFCLEYDKETLNDKVFELYDEIDDLKKIISKAIEYIEKFIPIDEDTILMRTKQKDYLLDVLNKGLE